MSRSMKESGISHPAQNLLPHPASSITDRCPTQSHLWFNTHFNATAALDKKKEKKLAKKQDGAFIHPPPPENGEKRVGDERGSWPLVLGSWGEEVRPALGKSRSNAVWWPHRSGMSKKRRHPRGAFWWHAKVPVLLVSRISRPFWRLTFNLSPRASASSRLLVH